MDGKEQADFLLETFGIAPKVEDKTPPATEPPATEPPATEPPATEPPATEPPATEPGTATEPPAVEKPVDVSKAEAAFAAMRVENKSYKQAVDGMAKLLGLDEKDPEKVAQAIQAKILEAQSKKENIPVDILARLDASDADRASREAEVRRNATNEGFAAVAKKFQLDETGIQNFAQSLKNVGINPYEMDIDLPSMYILQNHDVLMENARKEGIAKEAARLANVTNHSTEPTNGTGKGTPPGTPINTVKGLDALFKDL